jgi:hypothetical protein
VQVAHDFAERVPVGESVPLRPAHLAFEAAHATPQSTVLSPDKQSGKTCLLELVRNGWLVSNVSAAAVYRGIEAGQQPTLLLDEIDIARFW